MGADEQEDDPGGSEVLEDVWLPFVSGDEIAVKPVAYDVLVSQIAQVDGQFIAEFAVFVGIGDKDIERHALLLSEWNYVAVFIIPRNAAFVTKGSMNATLKKCRRPAVRWSDVRLGIQSPAEVITQILPKIVATCSDGFGDYWVFGKAQSVHLNGESCISF